MAKKLNSMPGYQARMPKQPHDTSRELTFTASTAMELPVYYDMLHLGDELHFNGNLFARLNPLFTAALAEIDLHVDYFFVPLSVMYTPAPSMFYQTDDLVSSVFGSSVDLVKDRFPLFRVDDTLKSIGSNPNDNSVIAGTLLPTNMFDCKGKSALRLCDLLDYNPNSLVLPETSSVFNPVSTPWFLCAYHACHELFYRNDDREPKRYLYQLDCWYNNSDGFVSSDLFNINYVSAYKDYFTSVKVSPIGSSVSMLNGSSSWDLLSKVNSFLFDHDIVGRSDYFGGIPSGGVADSKATGVGAYEPSESPTYLTYKSFNTNSIRQLFMVDKLLRVTGRADKDYESQFLAHFGIKIPHDVLHNITHIGHDMCTLTPSPVISSANTFDGSSGSALGEIGGQGQVSMNGKRRNFTAPCHGVFMAVFYALPRWRYQSGVSKLHDLSSPDKFWQPEYDRKGMQPIFTYEAVPIAISSDRVGWQFAYEQFKRKYDKASIAFRGVPSDLSSVNAYSPWVLSKFPFSVPTSYWQNPVALSFYEFYATPHDLDGIMQVPYQSTWIDWGDITEAERPYNLHLLFQTDPFILDYRMQCKKVNYMSEFGEPELD